MMPERFFALMPDDGFAAAVADLKRIAFDACGPQKYLDDAPHLTLGVGHFRPGPALEGAIADRAPFEAIEVGLDGWHTFFDDPVTRLHTLVIKLDAGSAARLREYQVRVLDAAAAHREKPAPDRYSDRSRYSPEMIASVERWGFPFGGSIWSPHFTIASFAPADYPRAWDRLAGERLPIRATLTALEFLEIEPAGFRKLAGWRHEAARKPRP